MRFFADHCVPGSIAAALDAVLLSLNGDFSDIVRYPPSNYGGIVSVQVKNRPEVLGQIAQRLTTYLSNQPDRAHYRGKLLLVEAHRIRIRGAT